MIQAPKGTQDIFGDEAYAWQIIEDVIRKTCADFCIGEIRTPTFEYTELFVRGVGETTDVVQKEMFSFKDRGDRDYSLRPEGTAGVARAFIQNGMHSTPQPTKLYYLNKTFRAERPQKGRMIEFNQFGVEFLGSYDAASDAEVISISNELIKRLGIKDVTLKINSLGDNESRNNYNMNLKAFIDLKIDGFCETCKERAEKNPLRVLDCKNKSCQDILENAPSSVDSLNEESKQHFDKLKSLLDEMGIAYEVDNKLVRGLDYYTKTVFEFVSDCLGSQSTVCGGGRYDNLIEDCGGQKTGACGFGLGMERLLIILEEQGIKPKYNPTTTIFIGSIGENGNKVSQKLVYELRSKGIKAESDTVGRSVKAQLKYADKINAQYSFVIGDDEITNGIGKIKNMETGELTEVSFNDISKFLENKTTEVI